MEIRDPVHGPIPVNRAERRVIDHPAVQRLRRVMQLGFGDLAFPGATHTRFLHSIGAMHLAGVAFDNIARELDWIPTSELARARQALRLAALLHDLGHPPLSHSGESILPRPSDIDIGGGDGHATHEEMTIHLLLHGDLGEVIRTEFDDLGLDVEQVAALLPGGPGTLGMFEFGGKDLSPLLRQLVSSELDVDRMDYLIRDSYFTGVAYGRFDKEWLMSHLGAHVDGDGRILLALDSESVFTFEDFLLSRFHMFLMVYTHHKTIVYHRLLSRFLEGGGRGIRAPVEPREFTACDDEWLMARIRESRDPSAVKIARKRPPARVIEAWNEDAARIDDCKEDILGRIPGTCEWIDSDVEFSKYFPGDARDEEPGPLLVRRSHLGLSGEPVPIHDYSDLFESRAQSKRVIRIFSEQEDSDLVKEVVGSIMHGGS